MFSRLILVLAAGSFALASPGMAQAKDAPSPVSLLMKHKPNQSNARPNHSSLKKLNLSLTKAECEEIERSLTDAYGPASQTRGNMRIWEVTNINKSSGQSKMVKIIAGEEDGRYFAKLDRHGYAASNNPRLRKSKRNKSLNKTQYKSIQNQSITAKKSYQRD